MYVPVQLHQSKFPQPVERFRDVSHKGPSDEFRFPKTPGECEDFGFPLVQWFCLRFSTS